jgi:hypothetical protein
MNDQGQPGYGWTAVLRRRPVRIAAGRPDGGHIGEFEIIRCDCGDDPDLDYREVTPELRQIRGPYPIAAGIAAYETHASRHPRAQRTRRLFTRRELARQRLRAAGAGPDEQPGSAPPDGSPRPEAGSTRMRFPRRKTKAAGRAAYDQAAWSGPPRLADRRCCCPARPVVRALIPPASASPYPGDLLLCGHHYPASQAALTAAGAVAIDQTGPVLEPAPASAETGRPAYPGTASRR